MNGTQIENEINWIRESPLSEARLSKKGIEYVVEMKDDELDIPKWMLRVKSAGGYANRGEDV